MVIDDQLIDNLSQLSRLKLSDEEKYSVKKDLSDIIKYMSILNSFNTDDMEALSHPNLAVNNLRDDIVEPSLNRDLLLSNAPEKNTEYFKVPKTVE